jgi:hypothetical protein
VIRASCLRLRLAPLVMSRLLYGREPCSNPHDGGRTWWAHFEFTRINIEPIILKNKIEDLREARTSRLPRRTFLNAEHR